MIDYSKFNEHINITKETIDSVDTYYIKWYEKSGAAAISISFRITDSVEQIRRLEGDFYG